MDNLNLILFVISGGFTILFALLVILWSHIYKSFEKIDRKFEKIDQKFEKIDQKIEIGFKDLGEKIHGLDSRLSRVEGILHSQDCCVIKEDKSLRQAE